MGVKIIKSIIPFLILILFSKFSLAGIIISEIMYNPIGSDGNHEWVEIYNNGPDVNISGWKFHESGTNHGLTLINGSYVIPQNQYAIIADNDNTFLEDYPDFNSTLFDSSFSLLQTGETIEIKNASLDIIDQISYNNSIGGGNNGNSISLINNTWQESTPTPGQQNSLVGQQVTTQDIALEVYLDDNIYTDIIYTKLFKLINVNPEYGKVYNITVDYNITKNTQIIKQDSFTKDEVNQYSTTSTGSFTATETGNYTVCGIIISSTANDANPQNNKDCKEIEVIDTSSIPCNISINISTEKLLYTDEEKIYFYNNINNKTFYYIIEYWIEDLFGNIVKKKINTTNTNRKTYSPSIEENDLVLLIKNKLYTFCNDGNISDNSAEELVIVKTTNPSLLINKQASSIDIEQFIGLSNDKAKFGQTIRIKANIYKGNTRKNLIEAWIEDEEGEKASKESKTNLYIKYTNYSLTIPIQIELNCDYEFDDGTYKVFLEGIDAKDSEELEIKDITRSLCEGEVIYEYIEKETATNKEKEYELDNFPEEIQNDKEFELELKLTNNDDEEHAFDVWSYVYRGSKSYSGEREANKVRTTLSKYESKTITLKNKVENAKAGDYKLKVKIKKDDQKTDKEITENIRVIDSEEIVDEKEELFIEKEELSNTLTPQIESSETKREIITIYESSNIKLKKLIPILIIILLLVVDIVLIWKR